MHRYLRQYLRTPLNFAQIVCAVALVLFLGAIALHHSHTAQSPEMRFTDRSAHGLKIVPASGESGGTCPVGYTNTQISDGCTYSENGAQCSYHYECQYTGCPAGYYWNGSSCVVNPYTDLTASAVSLHSGSLIAGSSVTFSGNITNIGNLSTSRTINNSFEIDVGNDGVWDSWIDAQAQVSGLAANASATAVSETWNGIPAGIYAIRLCADLPPFWSGNVAESNENNNCGATTVFTVTGPASGAADFDLRVNGSKNPAPIPAGQGFYFTWTGQNIQNCVPKMSAGSDPWWTGGAGISVGGYLPNSYGDPTNYRVTGLSHVLSGGGTYTYFAQCESTVAAAPSWIERIAGIPTAWAATLYSSVPVTITVCSAGQSVVNGVCTDNPGGGSTSTSCQAPFYYCGTGANASTLYKRTYGAAPACISTDSVYAFCAYGCDPAHGACRPSPTVGATISAQPQFVRSGMATQITWQATGVTGCNIHGTNDDSWICTGAACANGSHVSSAITQQTTYVLNCAVSGQPSIAKSVTVNVTPVYQEQ